MNIKQSVRRYHPWTIVRFLRELPANLRLFSRLVVDRRVSLFAKLILAAGVIYVITPLDFLDDFFPVVGQLDDLALLALACRIFLALCPKPVVEEHAAVAGERQPVAALSR